MDLSIAIDSVLMPLACLAVLPYFAFMLLTALSAILRGRGAVGDCGAAGPAEAPERRFLIVIPAHDEEAGVAGAVRSCRQIDYPARLYDVLVIADNCTDRTAAAAGEAGARVVERTDDARRSKGYAIEYLIERIREDREWDKLDALVIVDADTSVHPDLLRVFARELEAGREWVQGYDAVGNRDHSWRTRLMAYAFSLINGVTLQGQVAIGLSGALRGNGMCLSTRGLDRVPWRAHGLAEDLEYSWMVRIAGGRIGFAREARVYASMPTDGGAAWDHQRRRWETGRHQLRGRMLRPLLRSPHLGPLAKLASVVELTMPTTSWLCGAYLLLTLILGLRLPDILSGGGSANLILLAISHAVATAALLLQLTSPFVLSFLPWSFASCLLHFPYYMGWKAFIALGARPGTWVRTAREPVEPKP